MFPVRGMFLVNRDNVRPEDYHAVPKVTESPREVECYEREYTRTDEVCKKSDCLDERSECGKCEITQNARVEEDEHDTTNPRERLMSTRERRELSLEVAETRAILHTHHCHTLA